MNDTELAHAMFDIPLTRIDATGGEVTLRDLAGAQPVHVVLLRHLNCLFCQAHLGEVVRRRDEVGRVVVVSFAEHERSADYAEQLPAGVTLVRDEPRNLYAASTASRGNLWNVLLSPVILAKVLWFQARGVKTLPPKEDGFQLGADLVFDVHGRLVLQYVSQAADDRPPVDMIVAAMAAARSGIEGQAAA